MKEAGAHLTHQEAKDLVFSILDGLGAVEAGAWVGGTWINEMYDWCLLILSRIHDEDEGGNET